MVSTYLYSLLEKIYNVGNWPATTQLSSNPSPGDQAGLISRTPLPYDNYSVPLLIQDQQGEITSETMAVMVCDCGEGVVCKPKDPVTSSLGKAGIGLLFLGLLLFLCEYGKQFQHKYNHTFQAQ